MLCSGLSGTLLLAATCSLVSSGFATTVPSVTSPRTPTKRVITCDTVNNVQRLSCGSGVIIVKSALYGRANAKTCSKGRPAAQLANTHCSQKGTLDIIKKSCDGKKVCKVNIKTVHTSDPCSGIFKYLDTTYACIPATGSSKTCPPGWTLFGGRCFIFKSSKKNWTDAESSCQKLGGHLASYHSSAEYAFIRALVHRAAKSNKDTWVGGNDRQKVNVWVWSDGSKFDFPHWGSGEPSNTGGKEHCMEINKAGRDHVNDAPCGNQYPYVCVRKP